MRILRSTAIAFMLSTSSLIALSATAGAQVSVGVSVDVAPPALPVYEQPPLPAPDYIWTPGYWAWSGDDYFWVPGTWVEAPSPGLLWTPGYWAWNDGAYVFNEGYWGPHVGYYGGISYGFGYTGAGFEGGYWNNGAYFYNSSVNNVSNANITNVYNQTVVNNNTNNVSYNGGTGGTTAQPTAQELAAAKERHVGPTPLQVQHVQAASKDPAFFASKNHGVPAVAATARPGVFKGPGVVPVGKGSVVPAIAPANGVKPEAGGAQHKELMEKKLGGSQPSPGPKPQVEKSLGAPKPQMVKPAPPRPRVAPPVHAAPKAQMVKPAPPPPHVAPPVHAAPPRLAPHAPPHPAGHAPPHPPGKKPPPH
jgi:hypothetical protein